MGKNGKYALAIASRISTQTQKVRQVQNKSTYKYFQNSSLKSQKPDLFVSNANSSDNVYEKFKLMTNGIFGNLKKEQK